MASTWKHVDSELDRTCGKVVPVIREDIFGHKSEPMCPACEDDVYKVEEAGR